MNDAEPKSADTQEPGASGTEQELPFLKRYDQRIEDWVSSLSHAAEKRMPDLLSGLAAKARDAAQYLDAAAERNRSAGHTPEGGETIQSEDESRNSGASSPVSRD